MEKEKIKKTVEVVDQPVVAAPKFKRIHDMTNEERKAELTLLTDVSLIRYQDKKTKRESFSIDINLSPNGQTAPIKKTIRITDPEYRVICAQRGLVGGYTRLNTTAYARYVTGKRAGDGTTYMRADIYFCSKLRAKTIYFDDTDLALLEVCNVHLPAVEAPEKELVEDLVEIVFD